MTRVPRKLLTIYKVPLLNGKTVHLGGCGYKRSKGVGERGGEGGCSTTINTSTQLVPAIQGVSSSLNDGPESDESSPSLFVPLQDKDEKLFATNYTISRLHLPNCCIFC